MLHRVTRFLAYAWAAPNSAVGLLVLLPLVLSGARIRLVNGAVEVQGGLCRFILRRCVPLRGGASAITLGHIIFGADRTCLDLCRAHEHVHIRQCERWGPMFLPAYGLSSLWAWVRGGSAYRDNIFEREAYGDKQ